MRQGAYCNILTPSMKPELRRALALIVVRATSDRRYSAVYDYGAGINAIFSGDVNNGVRLYDHTSGAHIQGSINQFYHYGVGGNVNLTISGNSFNGYDYASGSHFNGTVRRQNVQLFVTDGSGFHQFYVT